MAIRKNTYQRTTYTDPNPIIGYCNASFAVDGNSNQSVYGKSCAISNVHQRTATWRVDLGTQLYSIHHIVVVLRTEYMDDVWCKFIFIIMTCTKLYLKPSRKGCFLT